MWQKTETDWRPEWQLQDFPAILRLAQFLHHIKRLHPCFLTTSILCKQISGPCVSNIQRQMALHRHRMQMVVSLGVSFRQLRHLVIFPKIQ